MAKAKRKAAAAPPKVEEEQQLAKGGKGRAVKAAPPAKVAEEEPPAKRGKGRAVPGKAGKGGAEGAVAAKKVETEAVKKPSAPRAAKGKVGKGSADGAVEAKKVEKKAVKKPSAPRAVNSKAGKGSAEWNVEHITAQSDWPITTGGYMQTPTFHPTEEEFSDFHGYMNKLDRLVGHMGVCKVVPPPGWKPRKHDFYCLEDSFPALDESVTVKRPIKQNAIGGKGLYVNVHEEKRSMKLADFKKAAKSKEFAPPVDGSGERGLTEEEVNQLERKFWRNVLFNPPMYGADVPSPKGFRADGREGLFDPEVCGTWDLGHLPSLLTEGVKRRVAGVNTPFLYVGMYRAAFAWHCEDMDLHSINYLHWGCPKAWYTVPATHGKKLEALARQLFPLQAGECREFLRHKTNMLEPQQLIKAGIPLTRSLQKAGEFIINFPGAYHSGWNSGYNCAESCNFATEYWVPFGVQAKPCSCSQKQNSVSIDVDAMIKRCADVKVKGEQWVECEECSKWRLLPPYMMHLMDPNTKFVCGMIEDMSCSKKEAASAWDGDGQWEVDGKVQIGMDPDKEQWVLCEACSKWRLIPEGSPLDADAAFVCSVLEGWDCEMPEQESAAPEEGEEWELLDIDDKRAKIGAWSAEDEEKRRVRFLRDELSAFSVGEKEIAPCGESKKALSDLLTKVKAEWAVRWAKVGEQYLETALPFVEGGMLARAEARAPAGGGGAGAAAVVAGKLWILAVEAEESREEVRKSKAVEKRQKKIEDQRAEEESRGAALEAVISAALLTQETWKGGLPSAGNLSPAAMDAATAAAQQERAAQWLAANPNLSAQILHQAAQNGQQVVGNVQEEGQAAVVVKEEALWRYQRHDVCVIALGATPPPRPAGMDDKSHAALIRLLSPSSHLVSYQRLNCSRAVLHPPPPQYAAPPPYQNQTSFHAAVPHAASFPPASYSAAAFAACFPTHPPAGHPTPPAQHLPTPLPAGQQHAPLPLHSDASAAFPPTHTASHAPPYGGTPAFPGGAGFPAQNGGAGWGGGVPAVRYERLGAFLRAVPADGREAVLLRLAAEAAPVGGPAPFTYLAQRIPVAVGYWALAGREHSPLSLSRAAGSHAIAAVADLLRARVTAPEGGMTEACVVTADGCGVPYETLRGALGPRAIEQEVTAQVFITAPRVLSLPDGARPSSLPVTEPAVSHVVQFLACETRALPPPYVPQPYVPQSYAPQSYVHPGYVPSGGGQYAGGGAAVKEEGVAVKQEVL